MDNIKYHSLYNYQIIIYIHGIERADFEKLFDISLYLKGRQGDDIFFLFVLKEEQE
jgi:hypothetical protein